MRSRTGMVSPNSTRSAATMAALLTPFSTTRARRKILSWTPSKGRRQRLVRPARSWGVTSTLAAPARRLPGSAPSNAGLGRPISTSNARILTELDKDTLYSPLVFALQRIPDSPCAPVGRSDHRTFARSVSPKDGHHKSAYGSESRRLSSAFIFQWVEDSAASGMGGVAGRSDTV